MELKAYIYTGPGLTSYVILAENREEADRILCQRQEGGGRCESIAERFTYRTGENTENWKEILKEIEGKIEVEEKDLVKGELFYLFE